MGLIHFTRSKINTLKCLDFSTSLVRPYRPQGVSAERHQAVRGRCTRGASDGHLRTEGSG